MCNIIGLFNENVHIAKHILTYIGRDKVKEIRLSKGRLIHYHHTIKENIEQPLQGKGVLVSNCYIYNWKQINKKFGFNTSNDSGTLLNLLDMFYEQGNAETMFRKVRDIVDGAYAFAYYRDAKVYMSRDVFGVKPLWYVKDKGFIFCSEAKLLYAFGQPVELHPRHAVVYDITKDKVNDYFLPWEPLSKLQKISDEKLFALICESVDKSTRGLSKVALLFSGGINSTVLAIVLKHLGKQVTGYVTGTEKSKDLEKAVEMGNRIGIKVVPAIVNKEKLENIIEKVVRTTESCDPVKVSAGILLYTSLSKAVLDKHKSIISCTGCDDVFAGYDKDLRCISYGHSLNKELIHSLRTIYERNMYLNDTLSMCNTIEMKMPFLDRKLVDAVLNTSEKYKVAHGKKSLLKKLIKHMVSIGICPDIAPTPDINEHCNKVNKLLNKLTKQKKFNSCSDYLQSIQQRFGYRNTALGALFSGGKDSGLALWLMMKRGYPINCMITIKTDNKESYMFHVPMIHKVPELARMAGLALVIQQSKGKKETEVNDLEKAVRTAIDKHKIAGITSGAVASAYQRDRIEKVTEKLGLKFYAPLWYMNQDDEMKCLFREKFVIKIVHTAAEQLSSWKGKILKNKDIELMKKMNLNINGEGGEYETLILHAPFFKVSVSKFSKVD